MDMQNVSNLQIPEGEVRTIHDKDNRLIWGRLAYDTKYAGNTVQDGTPTPDTPIPVQTVTGAQTVTISDGVVSQNYLISLTGKNLFDKNNYNLLEAYWDSTSTEMIAYPGGAVSVYIKAKPNTTYTASKTLGTRFRLATTVDSPQGGTVITNKIVADSATSLTITTGPNDKYLSVFLRQANESATLTEILATLQIEEGQTATPYAPYYNYELCKIGDYQDKIYKSGDDWYVHKEFAKYYLSDFTFSMESNASNYRIVCQTQLFDLQKPASNDALPIALCSHYGTVTANDTWRSVQGICMSQSNRLYIYDNSYNQSTSASSYNSWIQDNKPSLLWKLTTPTDTKITDATLIGQLNAVHEWLTRYGYSSTVTGNLPLIVDRTNL